MSQKHGQTPRWLRTYFRALAEARAVLEVERSRGSGKGDERLFEQVPYVRGPGLCEYCGGAIPTLRALTTCSKRCERARAAALVLAERLCPLCSELDRHNEDCRLGLANRDHWTCGICLAPIDLGGAYNDMPVFYRPVATAQGGDNSPANLRLGHLECADRRNAVAPLPRMLPPKAVGLRRFEDEVAGHKRPLWLRKYLGFRSRVERLGLDLTGPLPEIDVLRAVQARSVRLCLTCGTCLDPNTRAKRRYCSQDCADRFGLYANLAQGQCVACERLDGEHGQLCRLDLAIRDNWTCWLCNQAVSPLGVGPALATFDHVVPRAYKGPNTPANLRLAHKQCNALRGAPKPGLELIACCAPELMAQYAF
jgi:hypothetical protein